MFTPHSPARGTKHALAIGFLSFAITALFAPDILIALMVRDDFQAGYPVVTLAINALGAHAMAAGMFALCARTTRWSFAGLGVAIVPLLVLDCWLFATTGAFNAMLFAHAGGVIAMLALCTRGYRLMLQHEQELEHAF